MVFRSRQGKGASGQFLTAEFFHFDIIKVQFITAHKRNARRSTAGTGVTVKGGLEFMPTVETAIAARTLLNLKINGVQFRAFGQGHKGDAQRIAVHSCEHSDADADADELRAYTALRLGLAGFDNCTGNSNFMHNFGQYAKSAFRRPNLCTKGTAGRGSKNSAESRRDD